MRRHKIAYLGLLDGDQAYGDARGLRHLERLAAGVAAAAAQACDIELISCGQQPGLRQLQSGVTWRILPESGWPRTPWDACSWELPAALRSADIVHLHDNYSRTCELALLIARQQRKAVCLTDYGVTANWLTIELELNKLADVVICHDRSVAEQASAVNTVELLPAPIDLNWFGVPAEWPSPCFVPSTRPRAPTPEFDYAWLGRELNAIYRGLLAVSEEAAA